MTDPTLRDKLVALDPSELIDFIVNLEGHSQAIDRQIARLVRRPDSPAYETRLLEAIRSLCRRDFVGRRESASFADEVEDVVDSLEGLITQKAPGALRLADRLIAATNLILDNVDDSNGDISGELRRAYAVWLNAAKVERQRSPEARDWIDEIRRLKAADGYGLADDLLPAAGLLLTDEELRTLAQHYEDAVLDAGPEPDYTAWTQRIALGQVALALRDADLYVRSIRIFSPDPNEMQKEDLVRNLLRIEAFSTALEWLEGPWDDEALRLTLCAEVYSASREQEQQLNTRRALWQLEGTWTTLQPLLSIAGSEEGLALTTEAIDRARSADRLWTGLELLFELDCVDEAAGLAVDRWPELQKVFYGHLLEAAEAFDMAHQPLASTVVYRALLDDILDRAYSKAYRHAANYFLRLAPLHAGVHDWRGVPTHREYLAQLWDRHFRKRSFWGRVGGRPSEA